MDYKKLTVFNYQISYYFVRIFTFFWLWEQICFFNIYQQRALEFYNPKLGLQKVVFPEFPSVFYFGTLCVLLGFSLLWSLFKQSYWLNIAIFVLIFFINLPIAGYNGLGHHSHILILFYLFTIFLLPKEMVVADYKYVQYLYLGILITYSLAGIWKFLSIAKDIYTNNPEISWIEKSAAKFNSLYNYYIIDQPLPNWMTQLYEYENLWIVVTFLGILFQALCFLGAFNRKYLTFTMLYIVSFHYYTKYFVLADWKSVIIGVVFIFFPYHIFYNFIKRNFTIKTV